MAYVAAGLVLTIISLVLHRTIAPATGLVRTFYPQRSFLGAPSAREVVPDLSLDFLNENPTLPRRNFSIFWAGYFYLDTRTRLDLYAGADDVVEVFVDRRLVVRREPSVGTATAVANLRLAAGAHELIVRYQQRGGDYELHVLRAFPGEAPSPFRPGEFYPKKPDAGDVRVAGALRWLNGAVLAVWFVLPVIVLLAMGLVHEVRTWRRPTVRGILRHLARVALPALLAPVLLFVIGPHTVYASNPGEFNVAFGDIAWPRLIEATAVTWAILMGVGLVTALLSDRAQRGYLAFLFVLGLLVWIQSTFLVPDVGPLYGEGLNLMPFAWRAPYEAALWIAALVLALAFARRIAAVAPLTSAVFLGLQVAALGATAFASAAPGRSESTWSGPPPAIYRLSRRQNIVHVVLDGFLSEIFRETVEADRAAADRDFAGFVFFADHLGAFPTTRASMPAMLTGRTYRNRVPFDQFLDVTTHVQSVSSVLAAHGYAVHSFTFDDRDQPPLPAEAHETIVRYKIPTPYGSYDDYVRYAALELVDFSLFRTVPEGLKRYVYDDDQWFAKQYFSGSGLADERVRQERSSNHAAFVEELASRLTVGTDAPVYTFIHVAIPHPPIALDETCGFMEDAQVVRSTYTGQARCGLLLVRHLLNRLRALGVYDSSIVVLTSDHGWPVLRPDHPFQGVVSEAGDMERIVLSAMPLLAVKPAGAPGPLRVSYAHTQITDVPATILSLAGVPSPFPGTPALQMDAEARRPRKFAYHTWVNADWGRPFFDTLFLFSVDGRVLDPASWTFERRVLPHEEMHEVDGG